MGWVWRYENAKKEPVKISKDVLKDVPTESFSTQSDAESWIGQSWRELLKDGIVTVKLFEDNNPEPVYDMSLEPPR